MIALAVALAAAAAPPPEQAAGTALMQCVGHALGNAPIVAENATAMASNGLIFSPEPPPQLKVMKSTLYGSAQFAGAPSTEGQAWAVGYDSGVCMVMVFGTEPAPVEKRLTDMFAIPGTWKPEPVKQQDSQSRKTRFGWDLKDRRLTARMTVQPEPEPVKGFIMVTIAPEEKK
ncbi:hypothetical protein GVO57_05000 [Sphingomonas changnyeongensis]|uniref:Lipoprotein n=1 Tax=Sphingomonas changnyeongensis TaxID=2698679 RepID=A0A7Z2NVU3_9SPHN|nr:hypothetical protein [Sphingomonas changnyeongensis]QHL90310.1 hypothetical protein GVO57_05000 [Sphingomonas changnyeongensis]